MKEVELILKFNLMNDLLDNRYGCYHCDKMIEIFKGEYSIKDMLELLEYNLRMSKHKYEVEQLKNKEI